MRATQKELYTPMAINKYHFVSNWQVQGATCKEVFNILADLESFPVWWPSVYLSMKTIIPQVFYETHTKGWLPYSMRWNIIPVPTGTDSKLSVCPTRLLVHVAGDFAGQGVWQLTQNGEVVNIVYDWQIEARKPLLKYLSYLPGLKLIFGANHRWAMRQGEKALQAEVARRRWQGQGQNRELNTQNQL
jgi:hypothetical protein